MFYDDNQRVHGNVVQLPAELNSLTFKLQHNLRNTRQIHRVVKPHYEGDDAFEASHTEGKEVEWLEIDRRQGLMKTVSTYVENLVTKGQVSETDIAVLVGAKRDIPEVVTRQEDGVDYLGRFATTLCDGPPNNRMVVDSVRRFKGLERRVVIVAETKYVPVNDREFAYVALSRARTLLVVVGSRAFHSAMGKDSAA